jgi:hypothetical protein
MRRGKAVHAAASLSELPGGATYKADARGGELAAS